MVAAPASRLVTASAARPIVRGATAEGDAPAVAQAVELAGFQAVAKGAV